MPGLYSEYILAPCYRILPLPQSSGRSYTDQYYFTNSSRLFYSNRLVNVL